MIDQTTLGGTTLDPVTVGVVPMTCAAVSFTSPTVVGVPVTGGGGATQTQTYCDGISSRVVNFADVSLYHTGNGSIRHKLPSFMSDYNLGDGRITMSPTTGLTSLQN